MERKGSGFEKIISGYEFQINYNEDKKILTLYLKDENGYLHANKEYKLEIKDNTIVYTPSQLTQISK